MSTMFIRTVSGFTLAGLIMFGCAPSGNFEKGIKAYEENDWENAFRSLSPLAEKGDPGALYRVAVLYLDGKFVPRDETKGRALLQSAVDQNLPSAQRVMGWRLLHGESLEQDIEEGERLLELAAAQGENHAPQILCRAFMLERSAIPLDQEKSLKWCRFAAEQGYEDGDLDLGVHLTTFPYSFDDKKEGYDWVSKAYERDPDAVSPVLGYAAQELGRLKYESGDYVEALPWLEEAAEHGSAEAQTRLGLMHLEGIGIDKDEARGFTLLRTAARSGNNWARNSLADLLSDDGRTPYEQNEALKWAKAAANDGSPWAQNFLGLLYQDGKLVPKDGEEAISWFTRAANQGYPWSQFTLGWKFMQGEDAPKDNMLAYKWFNLCAANSSFGYIQEYRDNASHNRDLVANRLTRSELNQAQALCRTWEPSEDGPEDKKTDTPQEQASSGTGVVINSDGYVITNHHVTSECSSVFVDGNPARIVASDQLNDLAVVQAAIERPCASFRKNGAAEVGDQVFVVGYPYQGLLSSGIQATAGEISGGAGIAGDTRYVQISAPVNPGNSGGPLLDHSGHLVGVVTARLDDATVAKATGSLPQNVSFALKVSTVTSFLDANDIEYDTARSWWGKDGPAIVKSAREFTVLVECKN